MKAIIVQSL